MYKGLQVIIDYVGCEKAMHIVAKYGQLVLVPLLVKVSQLLNPSLENNLAPTLETTTDSLFGHTKFTEEASEGMLNRSSFCFGSFLYLQIKTLLHLLGGGIMPLDFHMYHFLRGRF